MKRVVLRGADLRNENLRDCDLTGADLQGADLRGQRLAGSDLGGAELNNARLEGSDLRGADLRVAELRDADLRYADLRDAHLCFADLRGADLSGADMRDVDLSGACLDMALFRKTNLRRANLVGASLAGATLVSANLINADLRWADLSNANLRHAEATRAVLWQARFSDADLRDTQFSLSDFRAADLRRVDLSRTFLVGANMNSARCGGTNFGDAANLLTITGLDSMDHRGPSSVMLRSVESDGTLSPTLHQGSTTAPDISSEFLRGCGLGDWEIALQGLYRRNASAEQLNDVLYEVFRLRTESPISFYSVFISYSHSDATFAQALHDRLQERGIRCWLDEHQFRPGDDIYDEIDRGIRLWDKVILCCSKASLTSWWVDKELEKVLQKEDALWKDRGRKSLALVPLDLDGFVFGHWTGGKASIVRSRYIANFVNWNNDSDKFAQGIESLIGSLRADDRARAQPPEPKL